MTDLVFIKLGGRVEKGLRKKAFGAYLNHRVYYFPLVYIERYCRAFVLHSCCVRVIAEIVPV